MYHVELNNRLEAYKRNGVLEGLEIYERSTPDMVLNSSPGHCYVDNETYIQTSLNTVTITTAHATFPRLDIVYYDTSVGDTRDTAGTAAATPVPPDLPAGDILLALVEVPPACTTIENCHIKDERIFIKPIGLIYSASDNQLSSSDTEENHGSVPYIKEKEIGPIPDDMYSNDTEFRIKFDLKTSSAGNLVYGRIYRNGVAVGTERSTSSTTYTPYSEDITGWSPSDLIQLYTHVSAFGIMVYVRNFSVCGDIEYTNVYDW